jgi:toxin FitB
MFLLDTNVVSETRKVSLGDRRVLDWAAGQARETLHLSVVSIQELEYGALLLRRKDDAGGKKLIDWIGRQVIPAFGGRILPIDVEIARACAALHVPTTRPHRDAMIAATALVHGLTVVTRDMKDFAPMDVPVLNPWEHAPQ